MEAGGAVSGPRPGSGAPTWLLGLAPLALVAFAIAAFALLDGPGLGERSGPPVEELIVERTVLHPGEIELIVRNEGPDAVQIAQVSVNDAYVNFEASAADVDRLGSSTVTIPYHWLEGEAYEIFLLTSTGGTFEHSIDVATETPEADASFFGLMALLGIYVGVIPVALGMLWLPFVRRVEPRWIRFLLALTVGLLVFLAIDAVQEGVEVAQAGPQAFGGAALVFVGALVAYLALAGIESYLNERRRRLEARGGSGGSHLALLIAVGIGLHNLGEGLAIGSAYSLGALALGAFLVVGFAIHNTTEGLAIVAPLAKEQPRLGRLVVLGLIAGAPAIVGAAIGATTVDTSLSAFLLGVGAGAIVQVVQQIVPSIRDAAGRALHPLAVAGILTGVAVMFLTGLLVSV
jgi:ZIP family zinc transporter